MPGRPSGGRQRSVLPDAADRDGHEEARVERGAETPRWPCGTMVGWDQPVPPGTWVPGCRTKLARSWSMQVIPARNLVCFASGRTKVAKMAGCPARSRGSARLPRSPGEPSQDSASVAGRRQRPDCRSARSLRACPACGIPESGVPPVGGGFTRYSTLSTYGTRPTRPSIRAIRLFLPQGSPGMARPGSVRGRTPATPSPLRQPGRSREARAARRVDRDRCDLERSMPSALRRQPGGTPSSTYGTGASRGRRARAEPAGVPRCES